MRLVKESTLPLLLLLWAEQSKCLSERLRESLPPAPSGHQYEFHAKGASIYDVRTEGGGGVSPKEDVVREDA